jgi:hypothetical protein
MGYLWIRILYGMFAHGHAQECFPNSMYIYHFVIRFVHVHKIQLLALSTPIIHKVHIVRRFNLEIRYWKNWDIYNHARNFECWWLHKKILKRVKKWNFSNFLVLLGNVGKLGCVRTNMSPLLVRNASVIQSDGIIMYSNIYIISIAIQ